MRILHISDIHAQINNFQTKRLRQIFLKKISELNIEDNYDYIFLTGDISHKGQGFNELAQKIILEILLTLNLPSTRLIMVPGNHDIRRNKKRTELIEEIKGDRKPSDFIDEILSTPQKKKTLLSSFEDYKLFYKLIKNESYPSDDLHHLIELEDLNLILCNTSIICDHAGEEGSLLIGKNELFDCLQRITNINMPSIAIGHHTLDCLSQEEKNEVLTMFDDFNIKLYLAGHVHKANYKLEADYYNDILTIVCSGMHSDGYTQAGFVDIQLENSAYNITQYIWNSEHKYWTTNNNLGRKMIDGTLIHHYNKPTTPRNSHIESIKGELNDLFNENERLWKQYGPQSIVALSKPLSTISKIWEIKCIEEIIPNNEKILSIIQENKEFIPFEKREIFELFKTHVEGFKNNHLSPFPSQDVPRFPVAIKNIFDK